MISNNLFSISPNITTTILPFLAAGALAWIAYFFGERV